MKGDRYKLRQWVVAHARQHGIKAAARAYGCSRNTVRKWVRRHQSRHLSTLRGHSRAPKSCPHKTSPEAEAEVIRLRQQTGYGAERLKRMYDLPCGQKAIQRIIRQRGLARSRKKKHVTKLHLREVKKEWSLFQQICVDTKYLDDLPLYWTEMMRLKLPRFQYTARDVTSGLVFVAYADDLSKTYATIFSAIVSEHLRLCGVDLGTVEWQSDNGSEFKNCPEAPGLPDLVRSLGSRHHYIPPGACTWQSDVETVHRLQEDEFFDRETFRDRSDFWRKITLYWHHFNLTRQNRGKEWQTPAQIAQSKLPHIHASLFSMPPLDLGQCLRHYVGLSSNQGGHDLPAYPFSLEPRAGQGGGDAVSCVSRCAKGAASRYAEFFVGHGWRL